METIALTVVAVLLVAALIAAAGGWVRPRRRVRVIERPVPPPVVEREVREVRE